MKAKFLLSIILSGLVLFVQGQPGKPEQSNSKWAKCSWLLGDWKGDGSGSPGQGTGTFTFSFDLGGNVIIRKSHTDFPATKDRPASTHEDLLVMYSDAAGQLKAIYFDNEGHTINYSISFTDNSVVFTSEISENMPAFRLIYTQLEKDAVNTSFEMSRDGKNFMSYLTGKSKKVLK